MVKLKHTKDGACFYFNNMDDCEKFICTFTDHCCNLLWEIPPEEKEVFPEMDSDDYEYMKMDPEERAINNLSWGLQYSEELTPVQKATIQNIIERI